jgi:hypothetical protein
MPVTVRGGDILFNDGTTQSTAGGAVNTTAVLNATAGGSVGGVGTYSFCRGSSGGYNPGDTVAGSALFYADSESAIGSGSPPGTWRCMARLGRAFASTLFLRIS